MAAKTYDVVVTRATGPELKITGLVGYTMLMEVVTRLIRKPGLVSLDIKERP